MSLYRDQLESWLRTIDVDCDSVLDVGGGEKHVKGRVKSFQAKKYKVLDSEAIYRPDYFGDLNYLIDLDHQFNILFCLEVFEYVWNPVQAIENLASFLSPKGIAYISFPTLYPLHNPPGMDSLRYTKFGIEKLLSRAFKSWEITPRPATIGARYLAEFWRSEAHHPMRNTDMIFDVGYLVKAIKNE